MTRLIRPRRIGGRRTEPRRCAPGRVIAAALAVSIAVLAIGGVSSLAPIGSVFAQTPGTTAPVLFDDLFDRPDGVELKPGAAQRLADAARRAQAPGSCPLGKFTIFVPPEGDLRFQKALGEARQRAVLDALNRQGIDPSRFFVDSQNFGGEFGKDTMLEYDAGRDRTAPTLEVTWTPPKATKVKAGGKITAKAVARDDANRWQTGINTIDLDVQGGRSFGFQDYPWPQPPCERPPPPQTLEGTYTVPSNPPPIVRLRAVTKDFAGHEARDIGEFPTGDWYGSLKFSSEGVVLGVKTTMTDNMDIALDHDGQGNLTGSLAGNRSFNVQDHPDCNWAITIPNKLRGKLIGSYTPAADVMSIQLIEPEVAPAPQKSCPGGGYIHSGGSIHEEANFKSALRSPRAAGDGGFQSDVTWMTGPITNSISLRLQRAQN